MNYGHLLGFHRRICKLESGNFSLYDKNSEKPFELFQVQREKSKLIWSKKRKILFNVLFITLLYLPFAFVSFRERHPQLC